MNEDALAFDLIIVGAGSGNSILDDRFDGLSVALIDDGEHFGGTCLNAGCIPTKMFVHVADLAVAGADRERFGLTDVTPGAEWLRIRDRIFGRTDSISESGLEYRRFGSANVTLFRETFRFVAPTELVGASGVRIRGSRIVIAAGSRPRPLPVAVASAAAGGIHDSDSIMRIDRLPSSLLIVGGGYVACEFAHVFDALGVAVTQVIRGSRLLASADDSVSERFTGLAAESWDLVTESSVHAIDRTEDGVRVALDSGAVLSVDAVLVAIGRVPNTDTLGAADVGFDLADHGLLAVDEYQHVLSGGRPLSSVFALGDVCSAAQLKHVANAQARAVQHNLLHAESPVRADPGPIPAAIFSRPQVASFGVTERDARATGRDPVVVVQNYGDTAWGWALEDTTSFCKLVVDARTGQLLGAHILGPDASILLQPLIQAASSGTSVRGLARGQYWPHPAATEIVENALLKAEAALVERGASAANEGAPE
ncbi:mycothione reductase [Planctomonas psychrotolerans]|uniref:mycothione reductase n=1 Tax=Planctomonas psychrotolerans TaxID=2528712 RepID=UPI00123B0DC0|nr:mycothione reductase [Planctomonas psychrotolerans]